jgi:hypothetical protein
MSPIAFKERMLANRDLHKEVSRWSTRRAGLALATETDTITGIDAGRHFDRQGFGFFYQPLAATLDARVRDGLTATTTLGTGLLYLKKALLRPDLTAAAATATRDRAATRLGTAAVAGLTMLQRGHPNLSGRATDGLLQ